MMEYHNFFVPFLLAIVASSIVALPVNNKDAKEETIAVYIPYDVKYVPVEIPDKFINVKPLKSESADALEPIVLRQGDVLNYLQNETEQGTAIKPVSVESDGKSSANRDNLVIVPVSILTEALKANTQLKPVEDAASNAENPTSVNDHEKQRQIVEASSESGTFKLENQNNSSVNHRLSKRQAQRFPFYRPVLRFSRIRGSRTRLGGASRSGAMVGYLSDRDLFPTVA